ncbi:glycosyl hydrolase [Plebeiibacterium sediminum]|uniref:Glycosyl hydrolase n=1 Tax=Plebeiibacterium sediminum TaxID=2992112 RepID=A0AAE3M2U1_9BACT|nr:glycosyl hydrolase [Plebeiobacterium sediminum]MCW3785769.1 glycosyl hydrolase [Plebeiobacterium sediminum]
MKFLHYIWGLLVLLCFLNSCNTDANKVICNENTHVKQGKSPKRGVSFAFSFSEDVSVLGPSISWYYNWSPAHAAKYDELNKEMNLDFCPMAWNGIDKSALKKYKERHPECKYLLTFNEPNLTDQANMTPQQAAQKWPEIKAVAKEFGLKLISPAMNYGTLENYGDPIVWLDEFFELVPLSDVDGISLHCYMASPGALKWYISRFKKYNKPIWLTEFCAWDGLNNETYTAEEQQQFMSDAINYLESDSLIYRYAWFIPRGAESENDFPYNFLLKNSSSFALTDLGEIFTQISAQDKNTYYGECQTIEAEDYSSICIAEGVGTNSWVNGPRVRVTNDATHKTLELYDFFKEHWVEYQINPEASGNYTLEIRYASENNTRLQFDVNGALSSKFLLSNTGSNNTWKTAKIPISLEKGKQTFRITIEAGSLKMNWLKFYNNLNS